MYRVKINRKFWFTSVLSFLFTSFFLPAALAFDTWNPVTGPVSNPTGTRQWVGMSSSSDGTRLAASAFEEVWLSADSGLTWTVSNPSNGNYRQIASSSDGSKLLLASSNSTKLERSTNFGASWATLTNTVTQSWHKVASSADGQVLAAAGLHGTPLYFSTNSGAGWTSTGVNANWNGIAISDSGAVIVAVAGDRAIYVSTDSGATWSNRDSSRNWSDVSISNDGTKMIAAVGEGQIYKSIDSGTTWTVLANSPSRKYIPVACSSDCSTILAGTNWQGVYYSSDSGESWYSSLPFPVPDGAPATAQIGWVNEVIAEPPLVAGAVNETEAVVAPVALTAPIVGAGGAAFADK